ncbi:hypothetical protein RS1P1_23340 [Pseudomonas moraviensis]|nr:hypothetical protein RS1P1_23340 [Pseudomonas moraviensis]
MKAWRGFFMRFDFLCKSLDRSPSPQPPETSDRPQGGEGEREPIFKLFKPEIDSEITSRCISDKQLGQSPLPLGEG